MHSLIDRAQVKVQVCSPVDMCILFPLGCEALQNWRIFYKLKSRLLNLRKRQIQQITNAKKGGPETPRTHSGVSTNQPTYGAHYCHWDIWDEVLYELCWVVLMLICSSCKRSGANQPITNWHDCQHQQHFYCSFHQTSAVTDDNISFYRNDC